MFHFAIEPYLNRIIEPDMNFMSLNILNLKIVLNIKIPAAYNIPTRISGETYIRIGTSTKNIKMSPERKKELWSAFNYLKFEEKPSNNQNLNFSYLKEKMH